MADDTNIVSEPPKTAEGNSTDSTKIYEEIQVLKEQLKEKETLITQLKEHVLTLETMPLYNKKRRRENDDWEQQDYDNKDDEIARLTKENEQLKQNLGSGSKMEVEDSFGIPCDQQMNVPTKQNDLQKIIKIIEEKLSNGFETIQLNVEKLINDKLNNAKCPDHLKPTNQTTRDINQIRNYAHAVGNQNSSPVNDLRTIMLVNKNEELAEEAERKSRSNNIIIHGKSETGPADDKFFTDNLIKELQIGSVATKQIERIGQKTEETSTKKRPIKLTMKSEEEKDKILNNLRNLKDKILYKGISITPDYTYSERMLIKEYHEQAKAKNDQEGDDCTFVWRVRGTPKNGLILKKLNKDKPGNPL